MTGNYMYTATFQEKKNVQTDILFLLVLPPILTAFQYTLPVIYPNSVPEPIIRTLLFSASNMHLP